MKNEKRYITIGFDAGREPLDELFWCEAEYDGSWTTISACDRIRTRRELVERIGELKEAVIGIDVALSFPKGFIAFLAKEGIASDHKALSKKIREDLKKNTEDGIRKWIEHMGRYRETKTETQDDAYARFYHGKGPQEGRRRRTLEAHELRTHVERFRRIDRILRHEYPDSVASTLGIQYNRLTRRYEFTSSNARGRLALVGLSFLEQVREAHPEVAIWPYERPKAVTVVETFPKLFEGKLKLGATELKEYFDREEDNALYVPREVREHVYAHEKARETLFALFGLLAAERRQDKTLRPLRDYRDAFYESDDVQLEGWVYGIGFREQKPAPAPKERPKREPKAAAAQEEIPPATEQPVIEAVEAPAPEVVTAETTAELISEATTE